MTTTTTGGLDFVVGTMDYASFSGTTSLGAPSGAQSVYLANGYLGKSNLEPDIAAGEVKSITLTRDVTFLAPVLKPPPAVPAKGALLTVEFLQDGTGGRTVTWDAVYKTTWSDTGNTADKRASVVFRYDGTNWIQQSISSWW
jgi:hypothetical protein